MTYSYMNVLAQYLYNYPVVSLVYVVTNLLKLFVYYMLFTLSCFLYRVAPVAEVADLIKYAAHHSG